MANTCINCKYKYLDAPCRDCISHDSLVAEVERLKRESMTEFEGYQARLVLRDEEIERSKRLNDNFAKEIEKLRCVLEISQNLTQQAHNEVDRLEQENERLQNKNNDLVKQLGSKVICDYEKGI